MKSLREILGSLAVAIASFGIAMGVLRYWGSDILKYWDNNPASTPSTPMVDLTNASFTLSVDGHSRNWSVGTLDTTTEVTKAGLLIKSNTPTNGYELVSDKLATMPREADIVQYNIEVTEGAIVVGVLDVPHDRWIAQSPVTQPQGSLRFSATSDSTAIVIYNGSSPPTAATIVKLVVGEE